MKKICLSLEIKMALKRRDNHLVEEELSRLMEEAFLEGLEMITVNIEKEALDEGKRYERRGLDLVRSGREAKKKANLHYSRKFLNQRGNFSSYQSPFLIFSIIFLMLG